MTTVEQLLLIVDRAERGSMLAEEAVLLRAGIRQLAREAREGACAPVSRPNSPRGSTGTTGTESASEAHSASDPQRRPKGADMADENRASREAASQGPAGPAALQLPRDAAEALYATLGAARGAPQGELAAAAEEIARLEEELVAARSVIDRVRALAEEHPGAIDTALVHAALGGQPLGEASADAPEAVVLCGSTRFMAEMADADRDLTWAGSVVLRPGLNTKEPHPLWAEPADLEAAMPRLHELHRAKIRMADRVLVVGDYIGESTRSEIAYARSLSKPVTFTHPEADPAA